MPSPSAPGQYIASASADVAPTCSSSPATNTPLTWAVRMTDLSALTVPPFCRRVEQQGRHPGRSAQVAVLLNEIVRSPFRLRALTACGPTILWLEPSPLDDGEARITLRGIKGPLAPHPSSP